MTRQKNNQKGVDPTIEKLKILMPYWISHNNQHIRDNEKWLRKIENIGLKEVAYELKEAIRILKEANRHIKLANEKVEESSVSRPAEILKTEKMQKISKKAKQTEEIMSFELKQIGIIRTPYTDNAPYQPVDNDEGDFRIVVEPQYVRGLYKLAKFRYIYIIYFIHRIKRKLSMEAHPPWTDGMKVGVFASRSPVRPNPIGLSIVRIKHIVDNEIHTSGLDVFDGTPLLDIKPYIKDLDAKIDANYGWIEEIGDREHLLLHIKGIPHDY